MRLTLITIIMLLPTFVFAYEESDYHAFAKEAQKRKGALIAPFMNELAKDKATSLKSQPISSSDEKSFNPEIGKSQKEGGSILIFVSFSMPKKSLVAFVRDATKIHASVVLRGLVNNSFKKTLPLIADIVKEAGGGGIEINPMAFSSYEIHEVPTIVSVSSGHENVFDALTGDVPLTYALKKLSEKGEVARETAKKAYLSLKGEQHG